jgi:acid phosphatase
MRSIILFLWAAALTGVLSSGCHGASEPAGPGASIPEFEHVFVVVEENENYDDIVGNAGDMPYLNSLIHDYGLATNYYANAHPSVNNYFSLTAGRPGLSSFWASDGMLADLHRGLVYGDNIAGILTDNTKTWKAYLEDLPQDGSLASSHAGYVKRHDPFAYFASVVHGTQNYQRQTSNLVPFEANFEKDLQNRTFPNYSFIVPDIYDDGHDDARSRREAACGDHTALKRIDQWLN